MTDPQFIEDFCEKNYCYEDRYNPEDTFSEKEYWRSLELSINYKKNFESYDNFFLQSLKKENDFTYETLYGFVRGRLFQLYRRAVVMWAFQ